MPVGPAARIGDLTAHGGPLVRGPPSTNVIIGSQLAWLGMTAAAAAALAATIAAGAKDVAEKTAQAAAAASAGPVASAAARMRDLAKARRTSCESRHGGAMTASGQLAAGRPHLVLEQLPQRLDQIHIPAHWESADIVMALDRHRRAACSPTIRRRRWSTNTHRSLTIRRSSQSPTQSPTVESCSRGGIRPGAAAAEKLVHFAAKTESRLSELWRTGDTGPTANRETGSLEIRTSILRGRRITMLPTSTSGSCSTARRRIPARSHAGRIATSLGTLPDHTSLTPRSVIESARPVATIPGDTSVTRRFGPASCLSASVTVRTAFLVAA